MDWIEAYLRDLRLRSASQLIISATGHEARTPRSVEAHGHEERDEDGHPVGTRVSVRFGTGLVGSTNASGMLYGSLPMTVFSGSDRILSGWPRHESLFSGGTTSCPREDSLRSGGSVALTRLHSGLSG